MIQIRCTKKVLDLLDIKKNDLSEYQETDAVLGSWYANIFILERRKTLIFMNENTYLSFILTGVRKEHIKKFPEIFYRGLEQVLTYENIDTRKINRVLDDCLSIELTKTYSRSVLGNLKGLVDLYTHFIYSSGGLKSCDVTKVMQQINRTPQRNLNWSKSISRTWEILDKISV